MTSNVAETSAADPRTIPQGGASGNSVDVVGVVFELRHGGTTSASQGLYLTEQDAIDAAEADVAEMRELVPDPDDEEDLYDEVIWFTGPVSRFSQQPHRLRGQYSDQSHYYVVPRDVLSRAERPSVATLSSTTRKAG